MEYVTIGSTGDVTDFGDLVAVNQQLSACAGSTRGIFGGGIPSSASDVIQYITIAQYR